jgi:hypothetical protein
MVEIKRTGPSDAERITRRLRPSNDTQTATTHVVQGNTPQRVSTTIHHGSSQKYHERSGSKSLTDMPIQPGAGAPIVGQQKKET